mmetsp:Transcript_10829/g.15860  ORF Transcript_10829/g.15860 Transcript_10829/m.15860 type:complete len:219 (-) Transcript_10829:110-766(-)
MNNLSLITIGALLLIFCLTFVYAELPSGDIEKDILTYQKLISEFSSAKVKYYRIYASESERYLIFNTLLPKNKIQIFKANGYNVVPDRNYTFEPIQNITYVKTESGEIDGMQTYQLNIPAYVTTRNETFELRLESVSCENYTLSEVNKDNRTCPFEISLLKVEPPVVPIVVGVLGGVAGVSFVAVAIFWIIFCIRDRLEKKKLKEKEKRRLEAENDEL